MPKNRGEYEIDFEPFDFRGMTPILGSQIKWKSRQKHRRMATKGIGTLVGIDFDGWFLVRYTINHPDGPKSHVVRIEPKYVVDYRPKLSGADKRFVESTKTFAERVKGWSKR